MYGEGRQRCLREWESDSHVILFVLLRIAHVFRVLAVGLFIVFCVFHAVL